MSQHVAKGSRSFGLEVEGFENNADGWTPKAEAAPVHHAEPSAPVRRPANLGLSSVARNDSHTTGDARIAELRAAMKANHMQDAFGHYTEEQSLRDISWMTPLARAQYVDREAEARVKANPATPELSRAERGHVLSGLSRSERKAIQRYVGAKDDGAIGPNTLAKIDAKFGGQWLPEQVIEQVRSDS